MEITTSQTLWQRKYITVVQPSEKRSVIVGILNGENSFRTIFVRTRKEIVPEIGFQSIIPNYLISSINRFLKCYWINLCNGIIIILFIRLVQSYFCQISKCSTFPWSSNFWLYFRQIGCGKFKIRSDGIPQLLVGFSSV